MRYENIDTTAAAAINAVRDSNTICNNNSYANANYKGNNANLSTLAPQNIIISGTVQKKQRINRYKNLKPLKDIIMK